MKGLEGKETEIKREEREREREKREIDYLLRECDECASFRSTTYLFMFGTDGTNY